MSGPTRILAPVLRKEWRALAIAMVATVVGTLTQLAAPLPLAIVVDHLVGKADVAGGFELTRSDYWLLAAVAALVIGISLVDSVVAYVNQISLARAGERIIHRLRLDTHDHLQRLSLYFHARRHPGDLVTRVTGDVNSVGSLFSDSLPAVVSAVLLLIGMLVVSVILDPVLALIAFGVTPLLALVTFFARRKLKLAARMARTTEGEIASLTAESFAAIREVKAFGAEPYEHGRLRSKSEERRQSGYDVSRIQTGFARAIDLIGSAGIAVVLVFGVFRVASGDIGAGELVVVVSYAKKTQRPLRELAREAGRIARSMARAERITEILATDDVLEERPHAYSGRRAGGELVLENVVFAYDESRPALRDVSLHVPAGSKLAVVGRSGAGKSTLAALLARFYDPTSGRVLLDGRDVRDCSLPWLRRQIGLVLQETVLFSGTVADNIAYGVGASQGRIEEAAKAAGAHGFISELPEGYETALGPRGVGLSGGQRQRIAIARTLLRNPSVLILDEPTTGLDSESETQVLDGLKSLMRGRTTIIISHSPRLVRLADRVVVVADGRLSQADDADVALADEAEAGVVPGAGKRRGRPARQAPVPVDRALPRLAQVLDPDAMAPFLERSLGRDDGGLDVRVQYLRYKPGTNIVVHYNVGLESRWHDAVAMIAASPKPARRAAEPENIALARLVDGRSPASMPLYYEQELDALIQWLPLDLDLPALAEPPARLFDELNAAGLKIRGAPETLELLAYKPRRRAVLRAGKHVLKIYADHDEFVAAATGLRTAGGLPVHTAAAQAIVPARHLTVQRYLAGTRPSHPSEVASEAGEVLRRLHSCRADELGTFGPPAQLAAARSSACLVATILPRLRTRIEAQLRRLEATMPEPDGIVPSHGDFNARQLLVRPDALAVIDFDAMCLAPAALDPANYAAQVVRDGPEDIEEANAVLDELLDGYGARPDGLPWYLAATILREAPRPFRYLDEHWPERVDGMVRASEAALQS